MFDTKVAIRVMSIKKQRVSEKRVRCKPPKISTYLVNLNVLGKIPVILYFTV